MKWDAIGAMGELVGAVAVVVSVLYLAWQVRSQVQETKLGSLDEPHWRSMERQYSSLR